MRSGQSGRTFERDLSREVKESMSINLNRDSVLCEVQRLLNKSQFTKEDSSKAERLMQLADTLTPGATELRRHRLAELTAETAIHDPSRAQRYRLTEGVRELPQLEIEFDQALRFGREFVGEESRALSVAIGGSGGFLVPQTFSNQVWESMKQYDNLLDPAVSTVVTTDNGSAPMSLPLIDDTGNVAVKVAEGVQTTPADIATFGVMQLTEPDTWRTNMQQVSMELAADSAFDLGQFLADIFGTRLARGIAPDFVSTLIAGAAVGKTGTNGQTTTVIYDDLIDLLGSVDPAYIASPKCGWAMRFSTLVAIMKLKASTGGSPMLTFDAGRFMLLGKPIYICPSVPAMAASAKSILFGDFSKFVIRRVRDGIEVKRFGETYAEFGMIAYQGFLRVKAGLAKAAGSDSPIKWYANSAT